MLYRRAYLIGGLLLGVAATVTGVVSVAAGKGSVGGSIRFEDRKSAAGIDFIHHAPRPRWCEVGPTVSGVATNESLQLLFQEGREFWKSRERLLTLEEFAHLHLIKMNGSGAAWLDFDRDGDWDLYLVNGQGPGAIRNALYENLGEGKFRQSFSGVEDMGEGMAVSVADYDNDGYSDIFLTNYGDFILYHNNGDGTFTTVTSEAFPGGVPERWYGGSAWGDYDLDGDLDLYVTAYVDFSQRPRETDLRFPMDFGGQPNSLYRNNGDGTFTEVAAAAGVRDAARKSMQAVFADFNADGLPDLFITNDTDANSLYLNRGDGTFKTFSGPSGLSTTDGSMGIAVGDFNGDQRTDLVYTNFAAEVNVLARLDRIDKSLADNVNTALFAPDFESLLVHKLTWPMVSWGPGLFDLDNDGDLDLFFANGHLNSTSGDNRQLNLLFENDGRGRFSDVSASAGIQETGKRIHRAAVFGDYDDDGKVDIFVTNNGQQVEDADGNQVFDRFQGAGVLYHNRSEAKNNWLKVRLEGRSSNRDAYGAQVRIAAGKHTAVQMLVSGTGYYSTHAKELYFGLGRRKRVDEITITWPNGNRQSFSGIAANQTVYIVEGEGLHQYTLILPAG